MAALILEERLVDLQTLRKTLFLGCEEMQQTNLRDQ